MASPACRLNFLIFFAFVFLDIPNLWTGQLI